MPATQRWTSPPTRAPTETPTRPDENLETPAAARHAEHHNSRRNGSPRSRCPPKNTKQVSPYTQKSRPASYLLPKSMGEWPVPFKSVDGYQARIPNAHHRTTPEQRRRADVILRQDDSFLAIGFLENLVPAVSISSISLLASRRSAVSTSGSVNQL
jgi:hypothetical protein